MRILHLEIHATCEYNGLRAPLEFLCYNGVCRAKMGIAGLGADLASELGCLNGNLGI